MKTNILFQLTILGIIYLLPFIIGTAWILVTRQQPTTAYIFVTRNDDPHTIAAITTYTAFLPMFLVSFVWIVFSTLIGIPEAILNL